MPPLMGETVNRRTFLFYGGAVIAGVTLGEFGRRQLARADARAATWRGPGTVTWATSVCRECPAGCGIRVRLVDDVPVKLNGNPSCPIARGRLCPKGQAALEGYFDPDRLVGPARRIGPRSDNRWEPITWDAAIASVAGHLERPGRGDEILALGAEEHGPLAEAWTTFWRAAGARVAWTTWPTARRLQRHLEKLVGLDAEPMFDLERATYVLSFGAPIVETWLSPVWSQRAYGRFRRGGVQPRGHLVHIDSRHSLTARKADEWLALPEARQATLAYGIASVLLREQRVDQGWLDQVGGNIAEFDRALVEHLTPDRVAEATGVPVVTLLRLARELAVATRPLVVVAADAPGELIDAALALNALIGAFDRPGGVFGLTPPRPAATEPDEASVVLSQMREAQAHPRMVVLRDASPLRARSTPADMTETLDRAELVVSFSPYLDEAAAVADLILPVHVPLEAWHALTPPSAGFIETVACAKPAVRSRLDTRDLFSVLRALADKAGGAHAAASTWQSSEQIVATELDRLGQVRRGAPYTNVSETEWLRELESGGWWIGSVGSQVEFAATVLEAGGWMDPFFASGRIRQALDARGGLTLRPPVASTAPPGTNGEENDGRGEINRSYPLRLVTFTPATVNLVGSANQPVLYELLGQPESRPWHTWVELNPSTAETAGIEHGAPVRIESAEGMIEAVVVHAERIPPDTVAVAFIPAAGGGRWARLHQADVRRLWGRTPPSRSCAVRLLKG